MKIELDIHELSVLIEAAWGGGTGLRMDIMRKAIDEWYHQMHPRDHAVIHAFFSTKMKLYGEGDVRQLQEILLARYDAGNKWWCVTDKGQHSTFLYNSRHYMTSGSFLHSGFITSVEKQESQEQLLEANIARDLYVRNSAMPPCPKCGERHQIQIMGSMRRPASWRCRTCKHLFEYEPE